MFVRALALLASFISFGNAQEPKPPVLTPEEQKLAKQAAKLDAEAIRAFQLGRFPEAVAKVKQSLELFEKLYPVSKYPNGHPDLAAGLTGMGSVLEAMGEAEQALPYFRRSLEMRQKLYPASKYPDGHGEVATSLNNMGFVLDSMGQAEQALNYYQLSLEMTRKMYPVSRYPDGHIGLAVSLTNIGETLRAMGQADHALTYARQSLEMMRKLYPSSKYSDGHPNLATSLNNLGSVLQGMGHTEQSLTYRRQSLEMTQKHYPASKHPDGHPDLAGRLNNLGAVLLEMGRAEQALIYYRQSLEMQQKLYPASKYPNGHPYLAGSLNNLAVVLQEMGQGEQSLTYRRKSLEMRQKLYPATKYPNGHPELATSLNNLGSELQEMGQSEQALTYYRQCMDMDQKLYPASKYPDGHPNLATSLNNLGSVLDSMGQSEQALTYFRKSLEMKQKLYPASKYPDGHPDLAGGLNNLGRVLQEMSQSEKALTYHRQGEEMMRKLYPSSKYSDGHPNLARSLSVLGDVLLAMGQAEQALTYIQQCFQMQQRMLRRELATASEEAAFDRISAEPPYRDAYLSVTRTLMTGGDTTLGEIWPSRAMVTRLLEQRQDNALAAGSDAGAKLDELRGVRRRIDQLLQDRLIKPEVRDKLLVDYSDKRDRLERDLVAALPTLKRWQELDQLGPADLAKALPPGSAFVDVIRYSRFEHVDKKLKSTLCYVAFVVTKDRPIQRIELDAAAPVDKSVQQWRAAIESRRDEAPAAAELKRLVWGKLAPMLPAGTTALYISADGDLARLPWAALPIGKDRVLLEDYALAQVPNGVFLLDQFKFGKQSEGSATLLTLGGVDYGPGIWPALPGTAIEAKAIATLATGDHVALAGREATAEKLLAGLSQARYVHLATHGEFQAEALRKERQRASKLHEAKLQGDDTRKVAAKNPLGYVGLVLAEGKILSGLGIVDLPLKNARLVTLSACETGLGEYTAGEGVQGLQRAFHLAGCPNVVASLWKVNDAATAALMAKFYHELWVNKKPPIEALREAQLTIYRNPELIADLAGERGAPRLKEAVKNVPATPKAAKRADTKLWAAFVLSGMGK